MKKLLNTLFVTSEKAYLTLEGENIVVLNEKVELGRYPLHILQSIVCFSYAGASPALMGACTERNIGISFCTPRGKFLARVANQSNGNVLLRKKQYQVSCDLSESCKIAKLMILGKVFNCRQSIQRTIRDNALRIDTSNLKNTSAFLKESLSSIYEVKDLDSLRGIEGNCANQYFNCFDLMLLNPDKEIFSFNKRNRRPPMDPVNALLSFSYSLLANDCASSLEAIGLDSYVGFLHRDKPGRNSLALDLMEELRPCVADRFVLTLINNKVVSKSDFDYLDSGAVFLNEKGRRVFLAKWQDRKQDEIVHPYLKEKVKWGMIPYVQALLLSRVLRGDLSEYPPFFWR